MPYNININTDEVSYKVVSLLKGHALKRDKLCPYETRQMLLIEKKLRN